MLAIFENFLQNPPLRYYRNEREITALPYNYLKQLLPTSRLPVEEGTIENVKKEKLLWQHIAAFIDEFVIDLGIAHHIGTASFYPEVGEDCLNWSGQQLYKKLKRGE